MHPEKTDSIKIKKAYRIGRFIMIPFGVALESGEGPSKGIAEAPRPL